MTRRQDEPQKPMVTLYRRFALGTVIFAVFFALVSEGEVIPQQDKGAASQEAELAATPKERASPALPAAGSFDEEPSEEFTDAASIESEEAAENEISVDTNETAKPPATDQQYAPQTESDVATSA